MPKITDFRHMNTASHFFRSTTKFLKKGGIPYAKTKAHPEVVTSTKNIIQQKSKTRTNEQSVVKPVLLLCGVRLCSVHCGTLYG